MKKIFESQFAMLSLERKPRRCRVKLQRTLAPSPIMSENVEIVPLTEILSFQATGNPDWLEEKSHAPVVWK